MTLVVLYDARCDLCCRIRAWLESQPKYVELAFIPAASDAARWRFPQLDHEATLKELTIVSDHGDVYRGAKAWLICLWALRQYRAWSFRLATPELMPFAQRVIARVSSNRFKFGNYRGLLRT
jgi:predicted DCC family thiol-disulfide oxidoreductase YuxK